MNPHFKRAHCPKYPQQLKGHADAEAIAGHAPDEFTIVAFDTVDQLARTDHAVSTVSAVTILIHGIESPVTDRATWVRVNTMVVAVTAVLQPPKVSLGVPADSWADYLADRTNPADSIRNKVTSAIKMPARAPAAIRNAATRDLEPEVDWGGGVIQSVWGDEKRILMNAAVRITAIRSITDDLNALDERGRPTILETWYDLEVAVGRTSNQHVYEVRGVASPDLREPQKWLDRIPNGRGATVAWAAGGMAKDLIANAIKGHDADIVPIVTEYKRTGWVEIAGEMQFLHAGGSLGERGETGRSRANLVPAYRPIVFPDPTTLIPAEVLTQVVGIPALMKDPTGWYALFGTAMCSVAGLPVGGVPYLHGAPNSGKTFLLSLLNSHLNPRWGINRPPMAKIDNTAANIYALGVGLENLWINADDTRPRQNRSNAAISQQEGIEDLVRRGFEPGAGHGKKVKNPQTGNWEMGVPEVSSPAVMLGGETIPDATIPGQRSTVERLLPVHLVKGKTLDESGVRILAELSVSDYPRQSLALFIQWVAQRISEKENFTAWKTWTFAVLGLAMLRRRACPVAPR